VGKGEDAVTQEEYLLRYAKMTCRDG